MKEILKFKLLIKNNFTEIFLIILLLLISSIIRLDDLGFSHFYGDETKTIFIRKDQSIFDFLFDQRKVPIQFLGVWVMEKITGGYDEFWLRFPFAISGILLVMCFYLFLRQVLQFSYLSTFFSSLLLTLNGIQIAFSRTAQYQMFYLLFGFISLILLDQALKQTRKKYFQMYLGLSSVFLGLSFLSHYDAIFFLIPIFLLFSKRKSQIVVTLGAVIVSSIYYIPYFHSGFFQSNTFGYLLKRTTGNEYISNYSLYTFLIYNPGYLYLILLAVLSIIGFYLIRKKELFQTLLVWFIVPFVIFEFVIQNPGTHTHNYLIPLFIASGIAFQRFGWFLRSTLIGVLGVVLLIQFYVFLPRFNDGYPFQNGNLGGFEMKTIDTRYHVPIYGFVYERGWKEIAEIMKQEKRVPNFSTNDNKVVSEFYLHGYFYQEFYKDKLPFYYVYIKNPQTQKFLNETLEYPGFYERIDEGKNPNFEIYKLKQ